MRKCERHAVASEAADSKGIFEVCGGVLDGLQRPIHLQHLGDLGDARGGVGASA